VKRPVRSPLFVSRCEGCMRRRACAFLRLPGYRVLKCCRQCLGRIVLECVSEVSHFRQQGR
jgi:hypothetical protein